MANFDAYQAKSDATRKAFNLLHLIRGIYENGKQVQAALALYQAATDPAFNAAVNAIFSATERQELGQMLSQITALVTDWEANHIGALQG
jgi:hypothetical protein